MSRPKSAGSKRPRDKYSRLICLGCRERRIRCELPSEVEIPNPGELRTVSTPCYRCKRLGVPCVVRQTVLGRPSPKGTSTTVGFQPAGNFGIVSRIIIELPLRTGPRVQPAVVQDKTQAVDPSIIPQNALRTSNNVSPSREEPAHHYQDPLLIHTPQSSDSVIIIRAVDTLRYEKIEKEWFRHLPSHVGHTPALDLCIKALVAACAYGRGVPKLTSGNCHQALELALSAVQASIKQAHGKPNDDILASTALLSSFEGAMERHGIRTRLHVEGLAAILAARPATYPVTQLAREILDFHVCESAVMACIHDRPSPFENVARPYFANIRIGSSDNDQAQLKALGIELFIRIPRLVGFVRSLRLQVSLRDKLLPDAFRLSKSLLKLQDSQAEVRLIQTVKTHSSSESNATSPLCQNLYFASVKDFEALLYYWQSRLSVLRLEKCLHDLSLSNNVQADNTKEPEVAFRANEMVRLVKNILMCSEYARTLPLRKHEHLMAHAMMVVWGVAKDVPLALAHGQAGRETGPMSDLLLRTINAALAVKPDFTVEDLDTAADVFVGGLPRGRFAKLYGL